MLVAQGVDFFLSWTFLSWTFCRWPFVVDLLSWVCALGGLGVCVGWSYVGWPGCVRPGPPVLFFVITTWLVPGTR